MPADPGDELAWLRAENALLKTEKDLLLRAAMGFAEYAGVLRPAPTTTPRRTPVTQTWLTPEAHARLQDELTALLAANTTAPGDDQERFVETRHRQARIRHLQDLLRDAVVGEDPPDDGVAEPGMVLTVRYDDEDTTETFLLGQRDESVCGLEAYSPDSPVGLALAGARRGEQRSYQVPSGRTVRVTLVDAAPFGHHRG